MDADPTTTAATKSPYLGDRNVVAGGVVSIVGLTLLAFFKSPWIALALLMAWMLGLVVGLHVQGIREAVWRQENDHGE